MTRPLSAWIAATAALLVTATPASANELVTNGGFESDFTGWLLSGSADYAGVGGGMVNSGANAAYFGPVGATASISQVLNTVAGQSYDVSFYLQNSGAGTNSFDAFFGFGLELRLNHGECGLSPIPKGLLFLCVDHSLSLSRRTALSTGYIPTSRQLADVLSKLRIH